MINIIWCFLENEPGHEKMCLISYANNKGADQLYLDSIAKLSRLLASFCGCAGRFVSGLVGNSRWHILLCRGTNVFLFNLYYFKYHNDSKFSDGQFWADSIDPDQIAPPSQNFSPHPPLKGTASDLRGQAESPYPRTLFPDFKCNSNYPFLWKRSLSRHFSHTSGTIEKSLPRRFPPLSLNRPRDWKGMVTNDWCITQKRKYFSTSQNCLFKWYLSEVWIDFFAVQTLVL